MTPVLLICIFELDSDQLLVAIGSRPNSYSLNGVYDHNTNKTKGIGVATYD
jgi:hypothetical protein